MENVASGKYQREEKHNSFLFSHRGKLKLCFPIKKSEVGNNLSLIGFIFYGNSYVQKPLSTGLSLHEVTNIIKKYPDIEIKVNAGETVIR